MGTEVLDSDPGGGRRGPGVAARSEVVPVDLDAVDDQGWSPGAGPARSQTWAGSVRRAADRLDGIRPSDWARLLRLAGVVVAVAVVVATSVQVRADRAAERAADSTLSVFAQATGQIDSVSEDALRLRLDLQVANLGPRSVRVAEVRGVPGTGVTTVGVPEGLGKLAAGGERSGGVFARWGCDDVGPVAGNAILETVVVTADGRRHLLPVQVRGGGTDEWSSLCRPGAFEGPQLDLRSEVVERGRALRIVYEPTQERERRIVPQRLFIRTLPGITLRTVPLQPIRLAEQQVVITVRPVVTDCLEVDARHMDLGQVGQLVLADGTEVAFAEGMGVALGRAIAAACP